MRRVADGLRCTEGQAVGVVLSVGMVLGAAMVALPTVIDGSDVSTPLSIPSFRPDGREPAMLEGELVGEAGAAPTDMDGTAGDAGTVGVEARGAAASAPGRSATTTAAAAPAVPIPAPGELRVAQAGWASRDETIAAGAAVPAGGLPVAAVAGEDDKRSYLRLSGSGRQLRLRVHSAPGSVVLEDFVRMRACPLKSASWKAEAGMRLKAAPAPDCSVRVGSVKQKDGTYTFDLSSFPDPTGAAGIAIMPLPGGVRTFHVVLVAA